MTLYLKFDWCMTRNKYNTNNFINLQNKLHLLRLIKLFVLHSNKGPHP